MVVEPWLLKMEYQVSSNFKNSILLNHTRSKKKDPSSINAKPTIGILSFEVANVLSKLVHLHRSLSQQEIANLKTEATKLEGVKRLVSSDESFLLELAYAERLDDLDRVAEVVSRLGKRCSEPALQGFEHVYGDITSGKIEVRELGIVEKDMEGMIKKMERYVGATGGLYKEMEALNELVRGKKKWHLNKKAEESQQAFELKLSWQRQSVKLLKDGSLWNQTYDKVIELLARTICTVYARIYIAFGNENITLRKKDCGSILSGSHLLDTEVSSTSLKASDEKSAGDIEDDRCHSSNDQFNSLDADRLKKKTCLLRAQLSLQRGNKDLIQHQGSNPPRGPTAGNILMKCLSLSNSVSRIYGDDDSADFIFNNDQNSPVSGCCSITNGLKMDQTVHSECSNQSEVGIPSSAGQRRLHHPSNGSFFGPKSRLASYVSPSTVGGSALGLHYANIIIVIEKLLCYPNLVGKGARDDLYQMLPASLRESLRTNLKSHVKNFASCDASLVRNWKETLDRILNWLAPLAHNMVRWQSERNYEKRQQIVTRTNVLLMQTLYFADRDKTEAAIRELLVGLSYICHYAQKQHALLNCAGSIDCGSWKAWQLQSKASCLDR